MMHGEFCLACSKRSLTLEAPTPTNISTKSEPEMLKKGTPASPAPARARSGMPVARTPTGADPDEPLYKARARDAEESHPGLAGHGPRKQRLAGPRRADQKRA